MPWDVLRAIRRQLRVEIGMRGAVNRLACDLAVRLALVCVNESRGGRVRRRSTTNHYFFLWRTRCGREKMDKNLPITLGCICSISNTKPIGSGCLSHTAVQQQWHWQYRDITDVTCVDEHLLALFGQSFPAFDSFLCGNEGGDNIHVQIVGNTSLQSNKVSISVNKEGF